MSEIGEVRRDDMQRDDMQRDDMRRDDMQRDDRMGEMPPEATTGDVPLTTEQIANPGAVQSAAPPAGGAETAEAEAAQLLDPQDRDAMTQRWRDIQANFVDQPRQAMQDADALVAGLMQQLAQMFSQERSQLEAQWSRGDEVSTEDLRVSLQRYRAFFERLLSV
jgi:hypothetical protein